MATIRDLIPLWLASVALDRKPATVDFYRKRTAHLVRSLGDRDPASLTPADLLPCFAQANAGRANDTIRGNAIAWNQFHKWLQANNVACCTIAMPKPCGRERTALPTDDQVRRILAAAPADWSLIYRALRATGARPNELVRATFADWDRARNLIVLADHKTSRKTGKPRQIAVGRAFRAILAAAISDRTDGPLFVTARGRPWTVDGVSRVFRRIRDRLRLPRDLVLYLTRHEHATKLYQKTKDLKSVADALGHATIATSNRYARALPETLVNNQDLVSDDPPPAPAPAPDVPPITPDAVP